MLCSVLGGMICGLCLCCAMCCNVFRVGRWDDMWVVLIVGSITETHAAAPDASLKTELSRVLRLRKYQKSRK